MHLQIRRCRRAPRHRLDAIRRAESAPWAGCLSQIGWIPGGPCPRPAGESQRLSRVPRVRWPLHRKPTSHRLSNECCVRSMARPAATPHANLITLDRKTTMEMITPEQESWSRVKGRLRVEVGDDIYSSWFARMDLEGLDEFHGAALGPDAIPQELDPVALLRARSGLLAGRAVHRRPHRAERALRRIAIAGAEASARAARRRRTKTAMRCGLTATSRGRSPRRCRLRMKHWAARRSTRV